MPTPRRKINYLSLIICLLVLTLPVYLSAEDAQAPSSPTTPTTPTSPTPAPESAPAVTPVSPSSPTPVTPGYTQYTSAIDQPTTQDNPQASSQELSPVTGDALSKEELEKNIKINTDEKRISLDLKGIDIVELFRIFSLKMNLTIVPTKSVGGRINIFLNNLTFEDALDVILVSQDLACERSGSIIKIMTTSEYSTLYGKKFNEKRKYVSIKLNYAKPSSVFNALSQVKSDIGKLIVDEATGTIIIIDIPDKIEEMRGTIKDLDRPLDTEIFDIGYAKASDMKTQITSALTTGSGELYMDERSGKLVVSDLPDKMKKIKRMVKAFDKETQQVFIEAEIIQIVLTDEYQRGIDWENLLDNPKMHGLDLKGLFPPVPSFEPSPSLTTALGKLAIGTLGKEDYSLTLKMLQTYGAIKILSRPRIAAVNNQEAKILVGTRDAYITQTLSQGDTTTITSESVQFIDVGIKLNVVPTINRDGFVTMKIKPEVSSVGDTITTEAGSRIPIVDTAEAETVVKVKDNAMIMIAGLMKEEKRTDQTGLPLLAKIPLLGKFFDSFAGQKKKTEIIIFISPHIMRGDVIQPGMEPEKRIPADIMPTDLKEDLFAKRLEEIKVKPYGVEKAVNPVLSSAPKEKESIGVNVMQEKMKGLKGY